MHVKKAMNIIHNKYHFLYRMPTWGEVPVSCSCAVCFPNCMCEDKILFASLFDPEVRVPDAWVTATVSRRKEQKAIGGTAGRKLHWLKDERACNEKTVDSKVQHFKEKEPQEQAPATRADFVLSEPGVLPSSSDDDFQVHTHLVSDRMPD